MAAAVVEQGRAMNLTHAYEEMALEKRPQDPHLDGTGLRFKTLDHGGDEVDALQPGRGHVVDGIFRRRRLPQAR
jgi:hypothetical protein